MIIRSRAAVLLLGVGITLPAVCQTSPSQPDPRIPQIIHSLEKGRRVSETDLSPDGKMMMKLRNFSKNNLGDETIVAGTGFVLPFPQLLIAV